MTRHGTSSTRRGPSEVALAARLQPSLPDPRERIAA